MRRAVLLALTLVLLVPAAGRASPDTVDVWRNVAYRTTRDWRDRPVTLGLDLYRPSDRRPLAVLVWLHGGGFFTGGRAEAEPVAVALARSGVAVAAADYRLRSPAALQAKGFEPALADARQDADAAVRWLRAHGGRYGLDGISVAVGGFSAGAFAALEVGIRRARAPACLVVSVSGGADAARVSRRPAPALFFHSSLDELVPIGYAFAAYEAIAATGTPAWFVPVEDQGHTFDPNVIVTRVAPRIVRALRRTCG